MIEFLRISSLAVFDEVELEFSPGLNCITGETGAGKSLILNALTLLMGARSSRDLIRPGSDRCIIEALFRKGGTETVLRREIHAGGASRCFVDARLATVNSLAEIASSLIRIYGQHDYQDLLNPRQQMKILEDMAGLSREGVEAAYASLRGAVSDLEGLQARIEELARDRAYLEHCLEELKAASLEEGMEKTLEQELSIARKAAYLMETARNLRELLYDGSPSLMDMASKARSLLFRLASEDESLRGLLESMDGLASLLEDINGRLRDRMEHYEAEPERIDEIARRLDVLRELKRKHRTDELGLVALRNDLEARLAILEDPVSELESARARVDQALGVYLEEIKGFLKRRRDAARVFCDGVTSDLEELGMHGCAMTVDQQDPENLTNATADGVRDLKGPSAMLRGEFLLSTNVGSTMLPLAKIASGGELSRIMLAIKARQNVLGDAVMVFDEVDAGISGQTALAIASKLRRIAESSQAIVVTHLHQVASVAHAHYVVTKRSRLGSTLSSIRRIDGPQRVMELARMMGGDDPSKAVIDHARELVGASEKEKGSTR